MSKLILILVIIMTTLLSKVGYAQKRKRDKQRLESMIKRADTLMKDCIENYCLGLHYLNHHKIKKSIYYYMISDSLAREHHYCLDSIISINNN